MPVVYIEERKKQKKLIIISSVLILITFFILWQGFFKESLSVEREMGPSVFASRRIKIDFTVLDDPVLKNLIDFEKIPSLEQNIGRENPFLPY